MALNRVKDFCRKTTHSKTKFYVLRALPENDPDRIPDPDGFLNGGGSPVWTDETVEHYIAAQLARSKQEARARAASTRKAQRLTRAATVLTLAAGEPAPA